MHAMYMHVYIHMILIYDTYYSAFLSYIYIYMICYNLDMHVCYMYCVLHEDAPKLKVAYKFEPKVILPYATLSPGSTLPPPGSAWSSGSWLPEIWSGYWSSPAVVWLIAILVFGLWLPASEYSGYPFGFRNMGPDLRKGLRCTATPVGSERFGQEL